MLSDKLKNLHTAVGVVGRSWSEKEFKLIATALSDAVEDALALEAQIVSAATRALPYPDNVIRIADILDKHGVTAGMPIPSNDGGAA